MADADGQQFDLLFLLDHGDHVAQVLFKEIRRVDRQRAVIDGRPVRDHHQDAALFGAPRQPTMRPFQRLAVDVFLEQALFHHQAQIGAHPPPGRIGTFVDDMAQVIEPSGLGGPPFGQPFLAALAALPRPGGKAQDLDLDLTAFQRAGKNIGADRGDGNRPAAHRAGIVQEQRHHSVAEFGVLLDLEGQGRGRVRHHAGQPSGVQDALFLVELPAAALLRLQAALQLVGQARHRAAQRFQLLVQIGAQPFQLGRIGQILGADLFVEFLSIDLVIAAGIADRRRQVRGRLGLGHLGLVGHFLVRLVVHADLGLTLVLGLVLTALGAGLGVFVLVLLAGLVVAGLFVLLGVFVGLVFLRLVRVLAQLVAIAKVRDHLARQPGEGRLIVQHAADLFQIGAGLFLDEGPPQVGDMLGRGRQRAPCCRLPHQIARCNRQRRIGGRLDLAIALAVGLLPQLGVDVRQRPGHVARTQRLAARGLHRLIEVAGHRAGGDVFRMGRGIVVAQLHRQCIRRAPRHQDLVTGQTAADLRQAHRVARDARRIGAEGHVQLVILGHGAGRLGQGLLERIGGIVGFFHGLLRLLRARTTARLSAQCVRPNVSEKPNSFSSE